MAAVMACGGDATAPTPLEGTYILAVVNGGTPPQVIWTGDETDTLLLDSARIMLRPDRTGEYMVAQALILHPSGGGRVYTARRLVYDITFVGLAGRVVVNFDARLGFVPDTLRVEPTGLTDSIRVGNTVSLIGFLKL